MDLVVWPPSPLATASAGRRVSTPPLLFDRDLSLIINLWVGSIQQIEVQVIGAAGGGVIVDRWSCVRNGDEENPLEPILPIEGNLRVKVPDFDFQVYRLFVRTPSIRCRGEATMQLVYATDNGPEFFQCQDVVITSGSYLLFPSLFLSSGHSHVVVISSRCLYRGYERVRSLRCCCYDGIVNWIRNNKLFFLSPACDHTRMGALAERVTQIFIIITQHVHNWEQGETRPYFANHSKKDSSSMRVLISERVMTPVKRPLMVT